MKLKLSKHYTGVIKMSDIKTEKWYESRRMWGGILAAVSAVLVQLGYVDIASALVMVAGGFGVTSWVKPKK